MEHDQVSVDILIWMFYFICHYLKYVTHFFYFYEFSKIRKDMKIHFDFIIVSNSIIHSLYLMYPRICFIILFPLVQTPFIFIDALRIFGNRN